MNSPCWILCNPRTGSSFLCELLNGLGTFPTFEHPLLKNIRCPLERGQAFGEWGRVYDDLEAFYKKPCPYAKMILHQYYEFISGIDKTVRYRGGWYGSKYIKSNVDAKITQYNSVFLKKIFPNIHFVRLHREPMTHAVSLYFARMTNVYHIYDQTVLNQYLNCQIPLDRGKLREAFIDALEYQNNWNSFLSVDDLVLDIDYDELISSPKMQLKRILDFLGIDGDVDKSLDNVLGKNKRIHRMTRHESKIALSELRKSLYKIY